MKNGSRVEWSQFRDEDGTGHAEEFYLIAEECSNGWIFYERSAWELRWYQIPPTRALVERAEAGNSHQTIPFSMRRVA